MSNTSKVQKQVSNCSFVGNMHRISAVLTVVCLMMCLTFNYTFPLHRKTLDADYVNFHNQTREHELPVHPPTIVERSKKMATNLENAIKRIKDSTQDLGKNIYDHMSSGLKGHVNILSDEDLRQYEQMVIMKKYPYLDLKELEFKYIPAKNTRQSIKLEHSPHAENDPGICEPLEDNPNVEITNRGLSGFAIPPELTKSVNIVSNHDKLSDLSKLAKKSSIKEIMGNLKDDIEEYVEKKTIKH